MIRRCLQGEKGGRTAGEADQKQCRQRKRVHRTWSMLVAAVGLGALILCGCQMTGTQGTTPESPEASEKPESTGSPGTSEGLEPAGSRGASAETSGPASYLLPDSDKEIVTWEEVKDLTVEELRLARNEIYARHGRGFQSQQLQEYFDGKTWYERTVEPDAFSETLLNECEKRNIRYLKGLEPVEGIPGLPEAPSRPLIDRYGYEDGHSALSFQLKPGTAKDCGDYFQVDAVFAQAIEAPGNLKYGDQVSLVFNEMTGETKTLEYREDGLYPVDEGPYAQQYYYHPSKDKSPVVLYQDSDDRTDKPVCEGTLYVRRDATDEVDIIGQSVPVTLKGLNREYNWYNGVFFDSKGYAVRLVFYGD